MEAPYHDLLHKIGLSQTTVAALYLRGSRGVGVGTETSDYDYVLVTFDDFDLEELRINEGIIDFTLFNLKSFQREVTDNYIGTMECIFSEPVLLNIPDPRKNFVLNKVPLLLTTMNVARNRRLRWKRTGQPKNLFIATRYMAYALELIETSQIKDIKCHNHLWYQHNEENNILETAYKKYKAQIRAVFQDLIKIPREPIEVTETPIKAVNYLRNFGLRKLCNDHQIEPKRHLNYPNLVQLYYRAYAPTSDIVRECRGLIVDESNNWSVVAYPFDRFNEDLRIEKITTIKDFETYNVYKKYDGSLCILYYYDGKWHVASSHTPDGSAYLCKRSQTDTTLRDAFWKLFKEKDCPLDKDFTYMFELTLKEHIVVTEEPNSLVFLGKRNIKTLKETPLEECSENWEKPEKWNLSESELLSMLKTTSPRKLEGVILHNPVNNYRIKIKTLGFQHTAHIYPICVSIKVGSSVKFMIERHNLPDFLERCPEYKYCIAFLKHKMQKLFEQVNLAYETVQESEWQAHPYKKMLFDKKKGKSVEESFEEFSIHRKVEFLS